MPKLFIAPNRHAEWLDQIRAKEPTALAMLAHMRALSAGPDHSAMQGPDGVKSEIDCALAGMALAWFDQDAGAAGHARREVLECLDKIHKSDLGKAATSLTAVLAWEFGRDLWEETERKDFAATIQDIARSFLEISAGNPHSVTNNWWMLSHGGCLLACMAVDGEAGPDGKIDLGDLKQWALGRFKAFCGHFGSAGLYHEGSGYITYTLSMLMPVVYAVEKHLDPDFLKEFPQLRRSIPSILVGCAAFEHKDSGADDPVFGASLQWNDAGRSCLGINPFIPGMALAPPEWRGALRAVFDRLLGIKGRNAWTCPYRGFGLAVALYPFSTTSADPDGILPRHVLDQRQGLGLWRSAWGGGDESVFGWYARSVHPGGHSQDDAASIRLMALGRTWICGGGQARGKAEWQSIFTQAASGDRPTPAPLAHVSTIDVRDSGGVVGMDTRKCCGAYGERYLSWRSDTGHPFCLAMLDLLDEHREPPLDWQWNLSFPRELETTIHEDGMGFTLLDPERGRLTGRFLIDAPSSLESLQMPGSSRTYSGGKTIQYPGDRYIRAAFPACRQGRILVGIVVSKEEVEIRFADNSILLNGKPWKDPFFPAILKSVDLAQSPPNRMRNPAGCP